MTDYRELHKNVRGACASCKHVRSKEPGLKGDCIDYDGGKRGYCSLHGGTMAMRDEPDIRYPIVDGCWEAIPCEI